MVLVAVAVLTACGNDHRPKSEASVDDSRADEAGLTGEWTGTCAAGSSGGSWQETWKFEGARYGWDRRNFISSNCTGEPVTQRVEGEFRLAHLAPDGSREIEFVLGNQGASPVSYTLFAIEGAALYLGAEPGSKIVSRSKSLDRGRPLYHVGYTPPVQTPTPTPTATPTPSPSPTLSSPPIADPNHP